MKKVYVIKGSEDGILGVTSNKKAAFRIASEYLTNPNAANADENKKLIMTYSQFCKELKNEFDECSLTNYEASFGDAHVFQHVLTSK